MKWRDDIFYLKQELDVRGEQGDDTDHAEESSVPLAAPHHQHLDVGQQVFKACLL